MFVSFCLGLTKTRGRRNSFRKRCWSSRGKSNRTGAVVPRRVACTCSCCGLVLCRMKPLGSAGSADSQSFLERLTAAFKDIPDDKKPLITKLGLTKNRGVGTVNCAFGKAPKRRPVSSQRHVQSSRDYKMYDDAPPRPLIPLNRFKLEPVANLPTLSAEEQRHVDVLMELTWETAYNVEQVTCRHRESIARFQKLRLTNHFREICTLRPGQSNVEHLLFKIKKEEQTCKSTQMKEDLKGEALQLYCRNMSTNWYLCGLVLHPSAPWLGALPDGLVYDPNEVPNFGLVHVKWTRQESFVKSKYLICKDGVLHLKKTNSLYWQVQGEMMVTGTSWCDLLLLSEKDILIQRIYRDRRIIKDMKKKLDDFFFYFYLPRALQWSTTVDCHMPLSPNLKPTVLSLNVLYIHDQIWRGSSVYWCQ